MTPTKTRPHKPMLAEWTSEILSLFVFRSIHLQRCVSEISNLGYRASTFSMSHPHELRDVPDSTTHVVQAEQANPTRSGPRVITL